MSYNGVQNAGSMFNTVGFNVWYPSANVFPTMMSVFFNGIKVGSSVTDVPTTKSTGTITKATTTVTKSQKSTQPYLYLITFF